MGHDMHTWDVEGDKDVYRGPCPVMAFAPLLHEQINALSLGVSCKVEWPTLAEKTADEEVKWPNQVILRMFFDGQLSATQRASVATTVKNHDGSTAIREDEAKRQRSAEILAQNQATIDSARAKRLAGQALTESELAAVADLFMFQGDL